MSVEQLENMMHISSAVAKTKAEIQAYNEGKRSRLKIFSNKFNVNYNGLALGEQLTIAARPGVGKSTIANLLILSLLQNNPNVKLLFLYWSMEMAIQEQILRLASYHIKNRTSTQILSQSNSTEHMQQFEDAGKLLSNLPVYFRDSRTSVNTCKRTWDSIRNGECGDYNVINIFDHTRLVSGDEAKEEARITNLMAAGVEYKNLMGNTNIYLSQLNRSVESASGKDRRDTGSTLPELSDIFGADSVGQFSTMAWLLHKPSNYHIPTWRFEEGGPEESTEKLIICKVGKNRNGPMGIVKWYEDLAHGRLYDSREELINNTQTF